jgi:hypothetical protein
MSTKNQYKRVRISHNWFNLNHYGNLSLKRNWYFILIFTLFNIGAGHSELFAKDYSEEYVSPSIKTVQFHRLGWPLSYPLIDLRNQRLELTFDEPGSSTKNYNYTIVLCDANWIESDLMITEYIKGIPVNPITEYSYSFNTTFDYVHYRLTLPNESMHMTQSGNYVLKVFEDYDQSRPVLIKKFMVVEQKVKIESRIRNTGQSYIRATHQEINFEVLHPGFTIHNPSDDVLVTIIQNGRTDNSITNLRPQFFRDGFMDFNYNRETLFEGGNEFRYFDIRSTRFLSDRIRASEFIDPFYHVTLVTDLPRFPSSYYYRQDLNGRYFIEVQEHTRPTLEADYIFVHFSLNSELANPDHNIYLNGALTNWQQNESTQMVYDAATDTYNKTLLLKQGYYNYQYLTVAPGETKGTIFPIENNHQQTENDYLILIYYKGIGDKVHQLIGAELFNSVLPVSRSKP